jgi:hypothetical protein
LNGWSVTYSQQNPKERDYTVNGKHLFSVTEGDTPKGPYYCVNSAPTSVLPGGRYAQIDISCDAFKGSLLIDGKSAAYKKLPNETHLYRTFNTETMRDFLISGGGITPHSFLGSSD